MNASSSLPGLRKLFRTGSANPSATSSSGPFNPGLYQRNTPFTAELDIQLDSAFEARQRRVARGISVIRNFSR